MIYFVARFWGIILVLYGYKILASGVLKVSIDRPSSPIHLFSIRGILARIIGLFLITLGVVIEIRPEILFFLLDNEAVTY